MTTSISRNLSHRRLIKQKNSQLLDYHRIIPKTTKNLDLNNADISNTLAFQNDHQTSISIDPSIDTSLSKRLDKISIKTKNLNIGITQTGNQVKSSYIFHRRSSTKKFKSLESISRVQASPTNKKIQFSVKKFSKNFTTSSQPKLVSMENLEIVNQYKKFQQFNQKIPKSETDLKQTLKKTSSCRLKLKVKDPFEKRVRLDIQFEDESLIQKMNASQMSTLNQEEFKEILKILI